MLLTIALSQNTLFKVFSAAIYIDKERLSTEKLLTSILIPTPTRDCGPFITGIGYEHEK